MPWLSVEVNKVTQYEHQNKQLYSKINLSEYVFNVPTSICNAFIVFIRFVGKASYRAFFIQQKEIRGKFSSIFIS